MEAFRRLQRRFRSAPSDERKPIVGSTPSSPKLTQRSASTSSKASPPALILRLFPSLGWKFQKYCTYGITASFFLLGGLEYGVVLPSLWQFLASRFGIGDDGAFLGLTMAAFSATSFVTSPLVGLVIDRLNTAKKILIIGCSISVLGNVLYFLALNKWYVLWGRVLCGAGWACRPALLTDITRTTTPEERTGIITIMMVFPQLGYFIGPAVNVILANFDFFIFSRAVHVDKYTAAGFVSACLFLLLLLVGAFCYFDLKRVRELEDADEKDLKDMMDDAFVNEDMGANYGGSEDDGHPEKRKKDDAGINNNKCDIKIVMTPPTPTSKLSTTDSEEYDDVDVENDELNENDDIDKKYAAIALSSSSSTASSASGSTFPPPPEPASPSFFSSPCAFLRDNIRDEVIVILCLVFNSTFAAVSIETAAFPWMDFLFGWTILANSMFGSVACGAVIITYFFLHRLSKKYDDRIILLALQGIAIFALLWLMTAYGQGMKYADLFRDAGGAKGIGGLEGDIDLNSGIWQLMRESAAWQTLVIIGFAFFFVSVPSIGVMSVSLLSKLLTTDKQGLGQGMQQNVVSISNIIGPLWAGSLLWTNLYVLFGIEIFLFILVLLMFGGSWNRLKPSS